MKHNQQNTSFQFQYEPVEFNKWTDKPLLQYCLGGTLYMPGTRHIVDKLLARQIPALKSMVMCFEDAIRADEIEAAQANVLEQLDRLALALDEGIINENDIPLIFLRVRNHDQFIRFALQLNSDQARILSGFVFPKYSSCDAMVYLDQLVQLNQRLDARLYGMPILEGKAIAYRETREEELEKLKELMVPYKDYILNVRVGGTDFSSFFGVRRAISTSIYDILLVRDILSDILNVFNRVEDGYTLSGPVWEYFLAYKRDDLSILLEQSLNRSLLTLQPILNDAIDGLLREVLLDKTNGFVGKTVIHPSHLKYVNAMQSVTLEEYEDAQQILKVGDGVIKSENNNKMNEANPHRNWARQVMSRAQAYGVIKNESEYVQLFIDSADPI
ncbi:HpcH/HpaI aldolase/citrate lyase family protein [Prosthecochloris sp. CIB 2401]|uniref:HpcH/HpaI aldolase/citrate lyase family protein n=1 Tax=Prosthecochloris sp. CIB 2401 TaxID=1868325 RepID=UPI00080A96B5|nr:HpcH/HpaI aldolase/citrate lyase family protein [Prosthecochloris sp. CIB 2401]ANT64597.1 Citrate lyase beta subunit [Prosthecochloris sp. CIB 2401]